jgi:hypothetical protein
MPAGSRTSPLGYDNSSQKPRQPICQINKLGHPWAARLASAVPVGGARLCRAVEFLQIVAGSTESRPTTKRDCDFYLNRYNSLVQIEGIDHIAMSVADVPRAAAWYIDVLGFEPRHQGMWDGVPVSAKATRPSRSFRSTITPRLHPLGRSVRDSSILPSAQIWRGFKSLKRS